MKFSKKKQIKANRNLRVLYFTPIFTYSDTSLENYYTREVNAVIQNNSTVEFLIYVTTTPKKNKVIKYKERTILVNRVSYKSFIFLKDMLKIFIKFKPQIIHSHYIVPSIIINVFAKLFRVPTILHGRGQDVNYYPYNSIKSKILLLIAGRLNNKIITVGKAMKNTCLRFKIKENKVRVIYNGLDFNFFNPKEKIKFSKNRQLELLNVGRYHPRKGQHHLIEACKKLKDININFHLNLIGEGILRPTLTELIKKFELEDYVDLLGAVSHNSLPNYMKKADIFVFPSVTEGLPNVILEAMSMKLVLVLTKIGGNLELAQNRGSILVDINNPQQLFDAILHYYNNPKEIETGGEINRKFIINNFNWDDHGKELNNLYNLLKTRRKNKDEKEK
jgi:glycosyltransferase involved in cell wall biosynthesis